MGWKRLSTNISFEKGAEKYMGYWGDAIDMLGWVMGGRCWVIGHGRYWDAKIFHLNEMND